MLIYQQKNPDIDIIYEIGIGNNAERTEQDAIKNLNTEIAAGTGPDIIVLDIRVWVTGMNTIKNVNIYVTIYII